MRGTLTKWTLSELLQGMLMVALITGVYWNVRHGHWYFTSWLGAVLSVAGVALWLHRFVRDRRVIFLIAAIACAGVSVDFWWLIVSGEAGRRERRAEGRSPVTVQWQSDS
jgi:Ni/Fe-hydrogenase subunit HybB-like protein